jgi:hypothetical protein
MLELWKMVSVRVSRNVLLICVGDTGPELLGKTDVEEQVLPGVVIPDTEHTDESAEIQNVPEHTKPVENGEEEHDANHAIAADESTEEDLVLQPKPEIPFANPLLKSVLEITPPTPRDSSPMQQVIDSIHPSTLEEPTSHVDRKEEEVLHPTEVCDLMEIAKDDEPSREGNLS